MEVSPVDNLNQVMFDLVDESISRDVNKSVRLGCRKVGNCTHALRVAMIKTEDKLEWEFRKDGF